MLQLSGICCSPGFSELGVGFQAFAWVCDLESTSCLGLASASCRQAGCSNELQTLALYF